MTPFLTPFFITFFDPFLCHFFNTFFNTLTMAEVKLDMTEYMAMKEIEAQLKASLEREKEWASKMEEMQKEKIKILEESKMKILNVTKTEHREIILGIRLDAARYLAHKYRNGSMFHELPVLEPSVVENLFEKTTMDTIPVEYTTFIGLDEAEKKIRKKVEIELKQKLDTHDSIVREKDKTIKGLTDKVSKLVAELQQAEMRIPMLDEKDKAIKRLSERNIRLEFATKDYDRLKVLVKSIHYLEML